MPKTQFEPFADESATRQLGDLTIENRVDRIELYGSLTLTRDKPGLALALETQKFLATVIQSMQKDTLPARIDTIPPETVANPLSPGDQ